MRQYRGLTKEGKWVYGWYIEKEDSHYNTYSVIVFGRDFEVIPETVGQNTGLKDKNGTGEREIYEGDAYRGAKTGIISVVAFQDGEYILAHKVDRAPYPVEYAGLHYALFNLDIKYIGNIHQPELMEKK